MFGDPRSIILVSKGEEYNKLYVHDQDSYGAKWLSKYDEENLWRCTDHYGMYTLVSQGRMNIYLYPFDESSLLKTQVPHKSYIYLRYANTIEGKLMLPSRSCNTSEISNVLYKTNRIYDNDVLIYKK